MATTIAEVKLDQALSGMRDMPALFYEGSQLDAQTGITFRGHPTFPKSRSSVRRQSEAMSRSPKR